MSSADETIASAPSNCVSASWSSENRENAPAPAARVPSSCRCGGQPAWLCARRQVLMHRGGGTYCVSRPLAISGCRAARCDALHRAARGSRLAHVCCWLSAARQKTQDSYENELASLTATATTRIHFGLRPNVKRPSPVSRRELSTDIRAGWHRRKLGFSAQLSKSAFTRGLVVS